MDINQLQQLINDMKALPNNELPEATLFSIGGRGYFENPTTDVLAFFCDSNGPHGLGNLLINALFKALPASLSFDDVEVISTPEREVRAPGGKRIDLLIEGNDWVMVIENKIYHQQNNPFSAYQRYVEDNKILQNKKPIYVVLSPQGDAPKGWLGLSYPTLLTQLKKDLANAFIELPLNKWLVLLREFILHMEGIMAKPAMPEETVEFVLNHLHDIKQVQDLKLQAIAVFQKEVQQHIQQAFPDNKVDTKVNHWHGYPAIRFYFNEWQTASDVVLFLDGRTSRNFSINYYACDIESEAQRETADRHLLEQDCGEPWNEQRDTIRCYKARFKTTEKKGMLERMVHKLKLLNDFEINIRFK
jgi:hypothetical protein